MRLGCTGKRHITTIHFPRTKKFQYNFGANNSCDYADEWIKLGRKIFNTTLEQTAAAIMLMN